MTDFRETLEIDGWIWTPVGDRGYMIDAVNRSTHETYRVLVKNEYCARDETRMLRNRGFKGRAIL